MPEDNRNIPLKYNGLHKRRGFFRPLDAFVGLLYSLLRKNLLFSYTVCIL